MSRSILRTASLVRLSADEASAGRAASPLCAEARELSERVSEEGVRHEASVREASPVSKCSRAVLAAYDQRQALALTTPPRGRRVPVGLRVLALLRHALAFAGGADLSGCLFPDGPSPPPCLG